MKSLFLAACCLSVLTRLYAQDIPAPAPPTPPANPFSVSGYVETYYGYDFGRPADGNRPAFVYSHNRHNEVNLNLGMLRGAYNGERVRGAFALMAGTYANANLAAEPGVLKNVYEANVGLKLSAQKDLWVDAGIFTSHLGFESAISKDCPTLTRSMIADNSPYYESGVRLGYNTPNGRWYLAAFYLNGWQRMQRPVGNSTPAFGTQITWKPTKKCSLNWSTFGGNDKPDSTRQMRYFSNLYAFIQPTERLNIVLDIDNGAEQKAKGSREYNTWYGLAAILRYKLSEKWITAVRGEYYSDQKGVIIATTTPNGFRTSGFSLNLDYTVLPNVLWRTEAKLYHSRDEIFSDRNQGPTRDNVLATTALAISF